MKADPIDNALERDGWHQYQSGGNTIWCKRWPDAPRCQCNDDKLGVQVVVTVSDFQGRKSYEIDVTAEKPDGIWVKLCAYSIGDNLMAVLNDQANQLVAAWTMLAQQPKEQAHA